MTHVKFFLTKLVSDCFLNQVWGNSTSKNSNKNTCPKVNFFVRVITWFLELFGLLYVSLELLNASFTLCQRNLRVFQNSGGRSSWKWEAEKITLIWSESNFKVFLKMNSIAVVSNSHVGLLNHKIKPVPELFFCILLSIWCYSFLPKWVFFRCFSWILKIWNCYISFIEPCHNVIFFSIGRTHNCSKTAEFFPF